MAGPRVKRPRAGHDTGGACASRCVSLLGVFGVTGLCVIYPLFLWVLAVPPLLTLIAIQVVVFYDGYYATVPSFLAELFPTRRRTTGVSIAYVLAQLAFGGVIPVVVSSLIKATGNPAAPGLYLAAVTALSLACLAGCWWMRGGEAVGR